jgi:alpha-tubulin suppressor-like RCC1 family protein
MRSEANFLVVAAVLTLVCMLPAAEVGAQGITVAPAEPAITVGQTQQFTAAGIDRATGVDAGAFHQCALLQDGTVRCWGLNDYGQLGNGTQTNSATPVAVTGLTGAVEVSGGGYHSCARLRDGTVRCWGRNSGEPNGIGGGQLGDPTLDAFFSATPVTVTGLTNATAVAAGGYHSCALRDGRVWCWGQNDQGQLGTGTMDPPVFLPRNPTPVMVTGITNAIAISAGGFHTCALLQGGTIRCWGQNDYGALGDGAIIVPQTRPPIPRPVPTPVMVQGITTAVAMQAGFFHTCALLQDGRMQCWGWNDFFQLGNDPPATNASSTPVTVNGITNPAVLAPGAEHSCVVLTDGSMRCWGDNGFAQHGNGSPRGIFNPPTAAVTGLTTALTASSGAEHTCAVLRDGRVQCWGRGLFGRLGDGRNRDGGADGDAITPVTAAGIGVMWTSSEPTVATIDAATGVATARNPGTTTITATSGGRTGSATLRVGTRPVLSVTRAGAGAGTIASSPPGIDCGAACSAAYDQGTVVSLAASAAAGSTFGGWTGCDAVSGTTCTVTMNAARSVTVTFTPLPVDTTPPGRANGQPTGTLAAGTTQTTLSLVTNEAGTCRYATSAGIGYGAMPGAFTTTGGTSHATTVGGLANGGTYTFSVRCQDAAGNVNPDDFTIAFSVAFPPPPQRFVLSVNRAGTGSGSVTSTPSGIDCGATCSAAYNGDTVVTLTAIPAGGAAFAGWGGCDRVSGTTCTVTMNAARSVTASFGAAVVSAPVLRWQYGGCTPGPGGPRCLLGWYASPAVADLDGDGRPDVIWGSSADVVALRGDDGSLKWRDSSSGRVWPGIAVADLTGDGTLEVVVGRDADRLTVYDRFGNVVWTRNPFGSGEVRTLAVADLENDGRLEIIVGHAALGGAWPLTRQLNVFEPDGTVRPGWPARRDGEPGYGGGMYNENVAVADMNGDGFREIFGPSGAHYITALDRNGSQLPVGGLYSPRQFWSEVGLHVDQAADLRGYANCAVERRPTFGASAPVIADVNGDGVRELIVVGNILDCSTTASLYHMPFILNRDRTRWSGSGFDWTVLPAPRPGSGPLSEDASVIEAALPNPVVADLDGDGVMEILYASYDGRVHAYWLDKTERWSWPYRVPTTGTAGDTFRFASEPVVADLNNDGCAEVIFTSWPRKNVNGVGQLHVLNCRGEELYRIDLPAPAVSRTWNGGLGAPTIADVDGDGNLEVVVGTVTSGVVAYTLPNTAGARVLWGTGRGSVRRTGTTELP